ncbi:MAG: cation:proton antiporter [Acidobacteria bacterium]|nr:cation:proton antiporter [Acidobacteriota bacterium]
MRRNILFYFTLLAVFGLGIYLILNFGARLRPGEAVPESRVESASVSTHVQKPSEPAASPRGLARPLYENLQHPLSMLLLQAIVILIAARVFGALFQKLGQPAVIGEMLAGIILGPSLLGMLSPGAQSFLFPASSMEFLKLLSQVGVILFMFVVGLDLNVQHLRQKADAAVLVSHASIIIPFFLGTASALLIYPSMAPAHISFNAFALFIGVAMSITAFPVLARIVEERGLYKTHLGSTVIACAAVDDVTAWCILAVVVAIVKADGLGSSLLTISSSLLFIGVMLFVLKPWAERVVGERLRGGVEGKAPVAWALAFMFTSALFTEVIGIHALFGAFLAGVVMPPRAELRQVLRERLGSFTSVFLMPLFFAFTGLRTQIGLLDDWQGWLMCLGVIAVAIVGKLGGSMLAARWTGMGWQESFSIGALMNTRGLIELIVLNLGYDLGILSPKVFTMMVIMALTTTFMTGPLLSLVEFRNRRRSLVADDEARVAA